MGPLSEFFSLPERMRINPGGRKADAPAVGPPTHTEVVHLVDRVRSLIFPEAFPHHADATGSDDSVGPELTSMIERCLVAEGEVKKAAEADLTASSFLDGLPAIRDLLTLDARAAYEGDPAAKSMLEIALCYPGVDAVFSYRIAHSLLELGVPLLPRMISEHAHTRTGVDIHPGATIGPSFFIDHATGVVIGETTEIGANVTLYQGVTLGARSFPRDKDGRVIRGIKRHPTIGDRVTIYAGAILLGGDTVIGDDCLISANVYCTKTVPNGHIVRQKHGELQFVPRDGFRG